MKKKLKSFTNLKKCTRQLANLASGKKTITLGAGQVDLIAAALDIRGYV